MNSAEALTRPITAPYILARREESDDTENLTVRPDGSGLAYLRERTMDRDDQGVLWARRSQSVTHLWPAGTPLPGLVHPARQRKAMSALHCYFCDRPASRTSHGVLFLAPPGSGERPADWPENALTTEPPLCLEHARHAVEQHDTGHVLVRARYPRVYGVTGTLYSPGRTNPLPAYLDPRDRNKPWQYRRGGLPWVLASRCVRELRGVTPVSLEKEIATASAVPEPRSGDLPPHLEDQ